MNIYQRFVAETYACGDYSDLARRNPDEYDIEDSGDGLFDFVMIELADKEGTNDSQEAIRRVRAAAEQLLNLADAMEGKWPCQ